MHLHTRNVNSAFRELVGWFYEPSRFRELHGPVPLSRRPSSNPNGSGTTLTIDEPVTVTYSHPRERVLFNAVRDANPFFHLYEALWMLAGRNDAAPLAYYNSKIARYSDDGKTFNGAYGYRWRYGSNPSGDGRICKTTRLVDDPKDPNDSFKWIPVDQLDLLVSHLKDDPTSRRAVLQMWNVEDDLLKIGSSKDVCCNLSVMFSLRRTWPEKDEPGEDPFLDMTVTNRSNDLLWGMLGANYVHFTFLQEYMAARLGAEVGKYHHFTNNLHVYEDRPDWRPGELLNDHNGRWVNDDEGWASLKTVPLVRDAEAFERELPAFVGAFNGEKDPWVCVPDYQEPFLRRVAGPALSAYRQHKLGRPDVAKGYAEDIAADDWRTACTQWLQRRAK